MTNDPTPVIPLEAEGVQPGFDIVLRGYDRGQVDRQIGWLEEQLGATDRQMQALTEALRQAEHDAVIARQQAAKAAAELERGRPTFEALGERIATILRLAEEEAAAMRQAGGAEIERYRGEWSTELTAAQRSLDEAKGTAEQQAQATMAAAQQEAQRVVTEARRSAAETTSAATRQVEAMAKQRDAIHAELVRVRERFAAVLGGTIDVIEQPGKPAPDEKTESEPTTVVTAAGGGAPPGGAGGNTDQDTARTQPMPSEPAG